MTLLLRRLHDRISLPIASFLPTVNINIPDYIPEHIGM
jgi:hypothetical protein